MPSSIGASNPVGSGETDDVLSMDTVKMTASFAIGALLFVVLPFLLAWSVVDSAAERVDEIEIPVGGGGL